MQILDTPIRTVSSERTNGNTHGSAQTDIHKHTHTNTDFSIVADSVNYPI